MPELGPQEALIACERALRQLFDRVFSAAHGPNWIEHVETDPRKLAKWRRYRENERSKRTTRGALAIPESELNYAEFSDLCRIAAENWDELEGVLGRSDEVLPLLRRFDAVRNTVAHSRPLLAFEADLLSGIAGQVRNLVTRYMTEQDPSGDYYARIESVTDSFGSEQIGQATPKTEWVPYVRPRINVGDVVTFECVAHDSQGRPLRWEARAGAVGRLVATATGNRVSIRWTVLQDDVAENSSIGLRLLTDSQYRRYGPGTWDDMVTFSYQVVPPS